MITRLELFMSSFLGFVITWGYGITLLSRSVVAHEPQAHYPKGLAALQILFLVIYSLCAYEAVAEDIEANRRPKGVIG